MGAALLALSLGAAACKGRGPLRDDASDAAVTLGSGGGAGVDPGGVLPYPFIVGAHLGGGIPADLTRTDSFATVLSCQQTVRVASLEGRAVVVRFTETPPLSRLGRFDDHTIDAGADTLFRLARWDEATGRFDEMEGPHLSLNGNVLDIALGGTWSAPQLFVVEATFSHRLSGGHYVPRDPTAPLPYRFAVRAAGRWRTGDGLQALPPEPPQPPVVRLDEDLHVNDEKMSTAMNKLRARNKDCTEHPGMGAFTPGWQVGWFGGAPNCTKPFVYAVHQRRDGKIESSTWHTINDAPDVIRARVEVIDHAWHVLITRPDPRTRTVVLDRLLRYDGATLTAVPLPNDQLGMLTWHRGDQLCVSGLRNMWCKNGNEWAAAGPGNCALTEDGPEFQSGICSRSNGVVPIVGDGRGAFRELSPMRNATDCARIWGRSFATLLCGATEGPGATLVFLPSPTTELDFPVPDPAIEGTVTFVGDVAWVARNDPEGGLMAMMQNTPRATKIVTRLGKPVRPWACSADASHLEQH